MDKENKRKWQKERKEEAENKIRKILLDGKPHLYGEIVSQTKLSKATATSHLKEMVKSKTITRIMDSSQKYPYPVYYRLNETDKNSALWYKRISESVEKAKKNYLEVAKEMSDPIEARAGAYLLHMNKATDTMLLEIVSLMKNGSSEKAIHFWLDVFVKDFSNLFAESFIEFMFKSDLSKVDIEKINHCVVNQLEIKAQWE